MRTILLPSYTFSSTANPVVLRGANPVFCDVRQETMNIDVEQIPSLVTKKTKRIVPVATMLVCFPPLADIPHINFGYEVRRPPCNE